MKKKHKSSNRMLRLMASLLILMGYAMMILPTAVDIYSRIGQTATIIGYQNAVDSMTEEEIAQAKQRSIEYNEKIAEKQASEFYHYSATTDYDPDYLSLPVSGSTDMCTIVIRKINVNLPVGHGTTDELLQSEPGHLYGTSLPVGGDSTHTVVAAHSALRSSEQFTRLDELKEGDYFDVEVLGETHRYLIDQIIVCLPEECDQYLQVEPGKDLFTLYTCTPYGINTHRLLVRGHRIADPVLDEKTGVSSAVVSTDRYKPMIELGLIVAVPVTLLILANIVASKHEAAVHTRKQRSRKEGSVRGKNEEV